jgi:hypothetical protein
MQLPPPPPLQDWSSLPLSVTIPLSSLPFLTAWLLDGDARCLAPPRAVAWQGVPPAILIDPLSAFVCAILATFGRQQELELKHSHHGTAKEFETYANFSEKHTY